MKQVRLAMRRLLCGGVRAVSLSGLSLSGAVRGLSVRRRRWMQTAGIWSGRGRGGWSSVTRLGMLSWRD
jgi:hypothetical protein